MVVEGCKSGFNSSDIRKQKLIEASQKRPERAYYIVEGIA